MPDILQALKSGPLLMDGALGTELERRGVDTTGAGWTSRANLENPELVVQIHREYIDAGAQIIITNSFRTNPAAHRTTGLSAETLTKRSVELAREAAMDQAIFVAGSIAPAGNVLAPQASQIDDRALLREHAQMATWLTESGADLILIETMSTIREAFIALVAAKQSTKLPVAVSLVPASRQLLLGGASLEHSVDMLAKSGADLLLLNCESLSVIAPMMRSFGALCAGAGLPWGVYPNASETIDDVWQLVAHEDHEFGQFAREALDLGASIVGACCGSTPATTAAMSMAMKEFA